MRRRSVSDIEQVDILVLSSDSCPDVPRSGLSDESELHQYVLYDTVDSTQTKGPKRINLNDSEDKAKNKYRPPENLIVHLSKISMPELQPKPKQPSNDKPVDPKKDSDNKKGRRSLLHRA